MTPRRLTVAAVAVAAVAVAVPAAAYWGFSPSASTPFTAAALANPAQSSVTGVLTAPNASLVSWTAPTNPDGTAFRVTRTTDNAVVCVSASTSCADTSPLPGILNTYAVSAVVGTNWVSPAAPSTAAVTPPDVFAVTGSAAAPVAGSPYPVTVVAKKWSVPANALVTDTSFASTTLTFSGPSNGPLGTAPTYPTGPTTFTDGTAFPSVTLRKAETVTLSVSAGSGNTRVFGSGTLNVSAGAASRLAFSTQPTGATAGTAFTTQPVVQVQDVEGNPTTGTDNVTLAVGAHPSGGALTCSQNPKAAVNGLVTYTGCTIDKAGTGYTLTASGPGSVTSTAFDVTNSPASTLHISGFAVNTPQSSTNSWSPRVTVTVVNGNNQVVSGVSVTGSWNPVVASKNDCASLTDASGKCELAPANNVYSRTTVTQATWTVSSVLKTGFVWDHAADINAGVVTSLRP